MLMLNQLIGFGVQNSGPVIATYVASASDATNGTSWTYTGHSIGTASADRIILICAELRMLDPGGTFSGVTVNGNAATQIAANNSDLAGDAPHVAIYAYALATGTTANIVVSSSVTCYGGSLSTFALTGRLSSTPFDTKTASVTGGSSALGVTLNVPAGGSGVAITAGNDPGRTYTWSGLAEDADYIYDGNPSVSVAHSNIPAGDAALSVSATPSGVVSKRVFLAVSFGP